MDITFSIGLHHNPVQWSFMLVIHIAVTNRSSIYL